MILVSLIAVIFTLLFSWDYFRKRHRVNTFARYGITGPLSLPLLGSTLDALSVKSENILEYARKCHEQFGKTFRLWILNDAQIYTTDVRHFEDILTSPTLLEKGEHYDMLRPWLADGLLMSVGRKWRQRRKVFTPAFHFQMLDQFLHVFNEQSDILVQRLKLYADAKTTFDAFSLISLAALDVITETAMGVKVQAQLNPDFPYVQALKSVVYIQANRMIKLNKRNDWMFWLTAPSEYRKMINGIRTMHDFTIDVIEKRREELQKSRTKGSQNSMNTSEGDIPGSKRKMALLDILLQSTIDGKSLNNEDIREEVDTFMFEGDDTTTSGISYSLYCISRHSEVQQKLLDEVHAVIGKEKNAALTMQQLQELKYMECVIKEVLRLYPPVPTYGRKTKTDVKLDGLTIPAQTSIYLVVFLAHRDPDIFPDPEAFKPERFQNWNSEDEKRNPFAYVPFSAGPKNCIGQKFALLEMKIMISKILLNYELLPFGSPVHPMANFILRSATGANLGLRPRVN